MKKEGERGCRVHPHEQQNGDDRSRRKQSKTDKLLLPAQTHPSSNERKQVKEAEESQQRHMNKQIIIRDQEQQPYRTRSRQQTEQKMKGLLQPGEVRILEPRSGVKKEVQNDSSQSRGGH